MEESQFHRFADKTLDALVEALELLDSDGSLEVESQHGVVTIELGNGKQFVISKHASSRQIWVSSPLSGGLHFSALGSKWVLADGRELGSVLSHDLQTLSGITVSL